MKIMLTANSSFKLVNFRAGLLQALARAGHELVALVPPDAFTRELERIGCRVVPLRMDSKGTSPVREALLLLDIFRAFRREQPDFVLSYTIKNNIYGALAARGLGIPLVPNVTGLGAAFSEGNKLKRAVHPLYRSAFRAAPVVFFQNPDDRALFVDHRLIKKGQAILLPGSGVDLAQFAFMDLPGRADHVRFLFVGRILQEKGVREFAEAARRLKARYPLCRFQVLGPLAPECPGALEQTDMEALVSTSPVEYLGVSRDVRPHIAGADCVVLPSYYPEGTPRALLEAGAMGRPIITTDMPGCRDTVVDVETGYLCHPRDAPDLAAKMMNFVALSASCRQAMGRMSRQLIEKKFDERFVIDAYLAVLERAARNGTERDAGPSLSRVHRRTGFGA